MTFLIQQTLLYAVPLMIVALAGVFAERSGIINLALEGIMIFGAFIGVLFVRSMQSFPVFTNAVRMGNWMTLQGLELMAMMISAILGALFVGVGVGLCVRSGGAPTGDDALAMGLSARFRIPIERVYLITDLTVLAMSLSYLPLARIGCSLLTVTLSGKLIGLIQRWGNS